MKPVSLFLKFRRNIVRWMFDRLVRSAAVAEYRGIRLYDVNHNPHDDGAFVARTRQALDLIQAVDPRRFARVQRTIRHIVNGELHAGGSYSPGEVCAVDFGRYRFDRNEYWALFQLAGLLIHEATHGVLCAKNIPYLRRNWVQVERICRSEQNRFLKRLEPRYGGSLQKPFDPGDWVKMKSWRYRIQTLMRRKQEEREKARLSVAAGDIRRDIP